jgi:predicted small secreted protein
MLSTLAVSMAALAGCNTMEGAGEDVSAAGRAVSKSAEETKQGM